MNVSVVEAVPILASLVSCNIVAVGKRRDGKQRYWCLAHRTDATEKYGIPAAKCCNSSEEPITEAETLRLEIDQYEGGIALWGAVPAIYDTTRLPMDRGIHVHARRTTEDRKEIDCTYRAVRVVGKAFPEGGILISELESIYYMVSTVFGFDTALVRCTHCQYPHLDKDFFSVNPHRRHLCAGCGKHFFGPERGIGNPTGILQSASGVAARPTRSPDRSIEINQKDYPGGIQIWGSNSSFLWTGNAQEEEGIHLHAYETDGYHPSIDETYSSVVIDGVHLDVNQVRVLMAQRAMPSLANRIVSVVCAECGSSHFEFGRGAYTPSAKRTCNVCESPVISRGRYRNVVSNPLVETLRRLEKYAVRPPQNHSLGLRAETL